MEIQPGAWYPFRSGSSFAWTWRFSGIVVPPFPTWTYSPTWIPACQVNPDWPGISTEDPAIGIRLITVYYASLATNFEIEYRYQGGTWRTFFIPALLVGSFDYGNPYDPRIVPTHAEMRVRMSGATAFNSTLDGVVTLYSR